MTVRITDPSELYRLLPPIVSQHHVILIASNRSHASQVAVAVWAIARAVAKDRRSVLLADVGLNGTTLDAETSWSPAGGVTDVFLGGSDLHEFAAEQDLAGLHYIGRGNSPERMPEVWRSDRWQRLARGFAKEGALLLLCGPLAAAPALKADGLHTILVEAAPIRPSRPVPRKPARRRSRSGAVAGLALAVVLGIAGVLVVASGSSPARETARRPRPPAPPRATVSEHPQDSLYYSVQVAAYSSLPQAMDQAASLERSGYLAMVSPARTGTQGVWYRVLTGALPTARSADSVLQRLWQAGLVERPEGTILRTPDTYRLKASRNDLPGLRARGIPAYIVLAPDGTDQVLVGAFDLADQAGTVDSLLGSARLGATLVRRTGTSQ